MRQIAAVRLAIGLAQGLALYVLYRASSAHVWPATDAYAFAPLIMVAVFVPLIALQGLGSMRVRTFGLWAGAAAILLVLLALYERSIVWPVDSTKSDANVPGAALIFFCAVWLFIAQVLVSAGDHARRIIAPYANYFDAAWKLGLQLALAALFTGVFWGVLALGAALFNLIGLTFLSDLIENAWFAFPASALAVAAGLHLSDVRHNLITGTRSIILVLLSWLLPLMALVTIGFLIALPFAGLNALWITNSAAALLLSCAAALVILINAAYQDGADIAARPRVLRVAMVAAALALVPLVVLSCWAIGLRVVQYGWTDTRIIAFAFLIVAACYAGGYAFAALWSRARNLRLLEITNIATSFVVIGVLIALFSPLASPTRIAVQSQVAQLKAGNIGADKFDFNWLRYDGGRYGHDALTELANSPDKTIREAASKVLAATSRYAATQPTKADFAKQISVYPADHKIPPALLAQDWQAADTSNVPPCLTMAGAKCDAFFAELTGDTHDEIIFTWGSDSRWQSAVLGDNGTGHWRVVGGLSGPNCAPALAAMRMGQFAIVAPTPPHFRAVETGAGRFDVTPIAAPFTCPKQ